MRLFEAILDANHRALAGDPTAGLRPSDFADALPVAALTCIDPRLNPLIPEVLGIAETDFIWLRAAGNVVTDAHDPVVRSLALACALKGAREIAIIGHTDCAVRKTTVLELTERLRALGVDRARLPDNLSDYFGLFASERQNVIQAAELVRRSPILSPAIPVHGLLVDIETGRLEWLVNGYATLALATAPAASAVPSALQPASPSVGPLADFHLGEMKFPEIQIGEVATPVPAPPTADGAPPPSIPEPPPKAKPEKGQPIPVPPPIRPGLRLHQPWKKPPGR